MMKKFWIIILASVLAQTALAVPAYPWPITATQPDGTVVTLQGHGDEWCNWVSTLDGFTLLRDRQGFWTYARMEDGNLVASTCVAHDCRDAAERSFLASLQPGLMPDNMEQARLMRLSERHRLVGWEPLDMDKFRGLVILVNYTDRQFIAPNSRELFDEMINREGYTGYTDPTTGEWVDCTGSVRDYFHDNTMGRFNPEFDVIGPVDVDFNQTYVDQTTRAPEIFATALQAIADSVDLSRYDANGDSVVDMVYFIVAGYGSNNGENNRNYLWPHAYAFSDLVIHGMTLGRYACSTELQGVEPTVVLNGIGVVCHEFSHVLTLPDLYDTDYERSNGQSNHPYQWSVLSGGTYLNNSRTPPGYGAYERYAMGILSPQLISSTGDYHIEAMQTGNTALRINTAVPNEFFLLENRQPVRWDEFLPGHGMMVWRVDSTDVDVWEHNKVNCNPLHNYFELVRATNSSYTAGNASSDPFPGASGVDSLMSRAQKPTLRSWTGLDTPVAIRNIHENDGVITFHLDMEHIDTQVETFEQMPVTDRDTTVQGIYAAWQLNGSRVVEPDTSWCHGQKAVALSRNDVVQAVTPITDPLARVTLRASNPNAFALQMQADISTDNGQTWTTMSELNQGTTVRIDSRSTTTLQFEADRQQNAIMRFRVTSGLTGRVLYLDDIAIETFQTGSLTPGADVTGDGVVDIADVNAVINAMLHGTPPPAPPEEGGVGATCDVTGDGVVDIADVNVVINAMLGKA